MLYIADIFGGIGGLSLGFSDYGKVTTYVEMDKYARKVYFANNPKPGRTYPDVTTMPRDILADILLAGFPCQPFSKAGKQLGTLDPRGTLIFDTLLLIEASRPKYVLLENVPRFKTIQKGAPFKHVMTRLQEMGYATEYALLNGVGYTPQNRRRLFIAGVLGGKCRTNTLQIRVPQPSPTIPLEPILEEVVPTKYTLSPVAWRGMIEHKKKQIEKGNGFGYGLVTPEDCVTRSLLSRYFKNGSDILLDQGRDVPPRRLTPRECARLMGFPDTFVLPVSDTQAYKCLGNSVVVPLIREIAKVLIG